MKLLSQYASLPEAYIDKGYLENQGIPALVENEAIATLFPAPTFGVSPIKLYVPDQDFARAEELMKSRSAKLNH